MQLWLTIKRDKRKVFCGHIIFMDTVLIEHGGSHQDVKEKMSALLQNMYELSSDAIQFQIKSHHIVKATNSIRRLKRKPNKEELVVTFNSDYFI